MKTIRIALAQINITVGDLKNNASKIAEFIEQARKEDADIIAFPELALCGYPPEDLLLRPSFIKDVRKTLDSLLSFSNDIISIIGFPHMEDDLYNAAAVIHNKQLIHIYKKIFLPNYGVFDEYRYFRPGADIPVFDINGFSFGLNICEDLWFAEGPTSVQALEPDCGLVINISSSPYYFKKGMLREKMVCTRAYDNQVYIAYVNSIGGQDELVFDGQSLVAAPNGILHARGRQFIEDLVIADIDITEISSKHLFDPKRRQRSNYTKAIVEATRYKIEDVKTGSKHTRPAYKLPETLDSIAEIYEALKLGLRDYVQKNGFDSVVIGLSGGIDSALTAAICTDALASDHVVGVSMPSRYSSKGSKTDAQALADNLGIKLLEIPIEPVFVSMTEALAAEFKGHDEDLTEENIQPRIRGMILMALSNKFGWLVVATGNKSEIAVGYTTLYGDMVGGFAVIKDIYKTTVYKLAEYRNSLFATPVIPLETILKPPSAELKPNQRDEDSLPPYPVLDQILYAYIEQEKNLVDIISDGIPEDFVKWTIAKVNQNEFKRRQGPIGIKISPRSFGRDRRVPITNSYTED